MRLSDSVRCRIQQAFLRVGRRPIREPEAEDGPGAMYTIPQLIRSNRLGKPLLVIGPDAGPWGDRLSQSLEENDIAFAVWRGAAVPPTADDGETLRLTWVGEGCGCFIALGGPETIDLTKAAAARAAVSSRTIMDMIGRGGVGRRVPPVVAVPAAAGSGAEALAWADIADSAGRRYRLADRVLLPPFAVLDPALITDTPRSVLAAAVMNGVCLAAEAYLSRYADEQTRTWAAEALRGFAEAAEPCWNSGGSPLQRERLLEASRLAGLAASEAGAGYARALSEAASSVTGIPFGEACAVLLPAVLTKYGEDAVEPLSRLSARAGIAAEGTQAKKAAALIARLRSLAFCMGLPDALEPVEEAAAAEIADTAAACANPRWASPVVWSAEDCLRVLASVQRIETKGNT